MFEFWPVFILRSFHLKMKKLVFFSIMLSIQKPEHPWKSRAAVIFVAMYRFNVKNVETLVVSGCIMFCFDDMNHNTV